MQTILVALLLAAPGPPTASATVVRGQTDLARAMKIAAGSAREILVVVDVTPYTARREAEIRAAAAGLGAPCRLVRLGEAPGGMVFSMPSDVGGTIPALRRSLKGFSDGAAVYLADWHFEDDETLEGFIEDLRRRRVVLGVVGSEAAFGRGWNDGFFPPHRGTPDARGRIRLYDEGISRSPFEEGDAPWHGGDTAYPHQPFRYALRWQTVFPAERRPPPAWAGGGARTGERRAGGGGGARGGEEDLRERLRSVQEDAVHRYHFPLPSGFGPYGLMRAAAETRGRYVLWSWNPEGRSDVTYDYARCNLFAPDLRDRRSILVESRPLAAALMRAWHRVASDRVRVASVTPPLGARGRRPAEMAETAPGGFVPEHWDDRDDYEHFLDVVPETIEAIDGAVGDLERALLRTGSSADAVDRRYRADADLFRHTLLVHRFQLAEALAAARPLGPDAWRDPGLVPGLEPGWCIAGERVEDAPWDPGAAARLLADRRRMLETYRGTPFGEMVRRNSVHTFRLVWRPVAKGDPSARGTPAESSGGHGPATGGGSRGGGPTTGG